MDEYMNEKSILEEAKDFISNFLLGFPNSIQIQKNEDGSTIKITENCDKNLSIEFAKKSSNMYLQKVSTKSSKNLIVFQCSFCHQKFSSLNFLESHVKRVHEKISKLPARPFSCTLCTKNVTFTAKGKLMRHIRDKHLYNPFFNPQKAQPETQSEQNAHPPDLTIDKLDPKSVTTQCKKCGKIFCNEHSLAKHLKFAHKVSIPKRAILIRNSKLTHENQGVQNIESKLNQKIAKTQCHKCGNILYSKYTLLRHLQFSCEGSKSNIRNKLKLEEPKSEITQCRKCGQNFSTNWNMRRHLQRHCNIKKSENNEISNYAKKATDCHFCGNIYETNLELRNHIQNFHVIKNILKNGIIANSKLSLQKVNAAKDNKKNLKVRQRMRCGAKIEPKFVCPHCKRGLMSKRALDNHLKRYHNNSSIKTNFGQIDKQKKCFENLLKNDKIANSKLSLQKVKAAEEQKRNFELRQRLKRLAKIEPKFVCPHCKRGFMSRQGLYYHLIRKHNLKTNFRQMGRERTMCTKFLCQHCQKCLMSKQALNYHLNRYHGNTNIFQAHDAHKIVRNFLKIRLRPKSKQRGPGRPRKHNICDSKSNKKSANAKRLPGKLIGEDKAFATLDLDPERHTVPSVTRKSERVRNKVSLQKEVNNLIDNQNNHVSQLEFEKCSQSLANQISVEILDDGTITNVKIKAHQPQVYIVE